MGARQRTGRVAENKQVLTHVIRFPGHFAFTIVVCAALLAAAWARRIRRGPALWKGPLIVLLAGILSGINAPLEMEHRSNPSFSWSAAI